MGKIGYKMNSVFVILELRPYSRFLVLVRFSLVLIARTKVAWDDSIVSVNISCH